MGPARGGPRVRLGVGFRSLLLLVRPLWCRSDTHPRPRADDGIGRPRRRDRTRAIGNPRVVRAVPPSRARGEDGHHGRRDLGRTVRARSRGRLARGRVRRIRILVRQRGRPVRVARSHAQGPRCPRRGRARDDGCERVLASGRADPPGARSVKDPAVGRREGRSPAAGPRRSVRGRLERRVAMGSRVVRRTRRGGARRLRTGGARPGDVPPLRGPLPVDGGGRRRRTGRVRAGTGRYARGALAEESYEGWRADTLSGTPDQVIDRIGSFADLGVEELIIAPWVLPFAIPEPEQLDLFVERVLRPLARA